MARPKKTASPKAPTAAQLKKLAAAEGIKPVGRSQAANTESGNTESGNTESGNTESGNTESSIIDNLCLLREAFYTLPDGNILKFTFEDEITLDGETSESVELTCINEGDSFMTLAELPKLPELATEKVKESTDKKEKPNSGKNALLKVLVKSILINGRVLKKGDSDLKLSDVDFERLKDKKMIG